MTKYQLLRLEANLFGHQVLFKVAPHPEKEADETTDKIRVGVGSTAHAPAVRWGQWMGDLTNFVTRRIHGTVQVLRHGSSDDGAEGVGLLQPELREREVRPPEEAPRHVGFAPPSA